MKLGDKGQSIGILQGDLTALGFMCTRDSVYGPNTVKAVMAFQKTHGLSVDGEAGPNTLLAISKAKGSLTSSKGQVFGIDVSGWQTGTNWQSVAAAGAKFAFIKATEGQSYVNPLFKADYVNAKTAGLIVGSYHFFDANIDGLDQAKHYIETVAQYHAADDLPLVLDLEVTTVSAQELLLQATAFLDEVEKAYGRKPIIYTNPATVTYLGASAELKDYPLWIAAPERSQAPQVHPWGSQWTFWQYTFKGQFKGTTGQDGNYFNGSFDDLKTFVAGKAFVQPKPNPDVPLQVAPVNLTPWMNWMEAHEGLNEKNNSQEIADLVWKHTNYTQGQKARTVSGSAYAWCAATVNTALEESGFKGNRSASAASFQTFGEKCGFVYGAIIPIRHKNGGHHVTFFHHWVDEEKKLAACLGGNQSDALKISTYNLSGNAYGADEVVPSPRWPVTKL